MGNRLTHFSAASIRFLCLDIERKHPSLGLLYLWKVLERVGKQEYGNPPKGAMHKKTMDALIRDMDTELTNAS